MILIFILNNVVKKTNTIIVFYKLIVLKSANNFLSSLRFFKVMIYLTLYTAT